MCKISLLDKISFFLVLIGSLNRGLIGLFGINLITYAVMGSVILQRLIYILIFVAAIDLIVLVFKCNPLKL